MARRRRATWPAFLFFLLVASASRLAWADAVLVVRPDPSDAMLMEAFSRLCGELRMYGLQVQSSDREDGGDAGKDLVGGIALYRAPGQANARIWIAEATTGKKSLGITVSIDDADAPSLLAIRAADLLWAGLRDFERADRRRERPAAVVTADETSKPAAPEIEHWSLQGGMGAFWETGDLGAGLAAHGGVARRLSGRLALALEVVGSLTDQTYAAKSASAHLRGNLGLIAIQWRLWAGPRFSLDLVQGLGTAYLTVQGEAQGLWSGQRSSTWTAVSSTGACLGFALSPHVGLVVSASAVFLLPRPLIEVAEVSYTVRQPLLITTGGLRYGF
jgi:hypothetical protein